MSNVVKNAQEIAGLGFWGWNLVTDNLYGSDQTYTNYGFKPQEFPPTFEKFRGIVHPDDLPNVQKNIDEAVQNNAIYDNEFRFARPNGEIRYLHAKGNVIRDNDGNALPFVGTQTDITRRKQTEERLEFLSHVKAVCIFNNYIRHILFG